MKKSTCVRTLVILSALSGMVFAGCADQKNSASVSASGSQTSVPTSSGTSTSTAPSSSNPSTSNVPSSPSTQPSVTSSSPVSPSTPASPTSPEPSVSTPVSTSVKAEVSVTLNGASEVVLDKSITLTATVSNADNTEVIWSTSQDTILTVTDGVVTAVGLGKATITATSVEDPTKAASQEITVIDKYAFRITENNTYKVEAENLDFSKATLRSDLANAGMGFIEEPSGDAAALTSGGKSVRGIVNPSTLTVSFYAAKASKVHFNGRFAYYNAGFTLDDNLTLTLDNKPMGSTNAVFGGHSAPSDYWPWQDVAMGDLLVPEGEHSFVIDVTKELPNADYVSFVVSDYDAVSDIFSITENGTTTIEAETMDFTNLVIRPDLVAAGKTKETIVEDATDASNGKSIGGIGTGTVLTAEFYLGDEALVTPIARMADYSDTFDVDGNIEFKLDDTVINSNGYNAFGHTEANMWWNWKNVRLSETVLAKGFHTFTYKVTNSGINLDAFLFETSYYGRVSERGIQLNKNGTSIVEAESLKVTAGSYVAEAPAGDALASTSGGKSIGNVANGTDFEIPFVLGNKATVEITGVFAKYEDSWKLDDNVTIKIDDTLVTTGYSSFGHTENNVWWNWKDVTIKRDLFEAGKHTLSIVAVNGFPNTDCFKFAVSGYGDDFSANANGNYNIEAETLPYNNLAFDAAGSAGRIESDSRSSGGKSLGHITGGYVEMPFYLEAKAVVTPISVIAKYESVAVGENYKIYMDGTEIAFKDPTMTLGRASDGSNDWYNWKQIPGSDQTLEAGEHIFKFECTNAPCGMDCFTFAVASYGV